MRRDETMCPLLTAALAAGGSGGEAYCDPGRCMWAMRKTALGDDGRWRTVGYRCAVAVGSDRYVDLNSIPPTD